MSPRCYNEDGPRKGTVHPCFGLIKFCLIKYLTSAEKGGNRNINEVGILLMKS